jgi:hypothetical protein
MPNRRVLGAVVRLGVAAGAALLAAASATQPQQGGYGAAYPGAPEPSSMFRPPAPEPMAPEAALGLYRSSFGPVKIERDPESGAQSAVVGVWVYDRGGEEVVGLFEGQLQGNVLEFTWQEPAAPAPLSGQGFLVFHRDGAGFYGKWWSADGRRSGDWTGDKYVGNGPAEQAPASVDPS